jgi:hypothetical protein|nr:MAG: hypothetical protein J07AB56_03420 [Candidatus Nanosalinarum sp. J07AB56]
MPDEEDDLAALREQTSHGDRLDQAEADEATQELVDGIVTELEAIDAGEKQQTLSVWDGPLAAFIRALENSPEQMDAVGEGLQQRLDIDTGDVDRSEVLRLALRLGFEQAAPDQFDAVREAVKQQATKDL